MHQLHTRHKRFLWVLFAALLATAFSSGMYAADERPVFVPLISKGGGSPVTLPPVTASKRWSDPDTWPNKRVPVAGDAVVIGQDQHVLLDVSPPALKSLMIMGSLVFDAQDLTLTSGYIMLHGGTLAVGSAAQPFTQTATITLNAADPTEDHMAMGTRGILLMDGGRLDLFGSAPAVAWTKLNDHAPAGATRLELAQRVRWQPGDRVVVAPTDFYGIGATEQLTVSAVADQALTFSTPLQKGRWGKLQYIGNNGMTLVKDTSVTTLTLDARAEVGNVSRNIVVQGADDALWREQGFGAHIMAMTNSTLRIDGVELRRVGQAGKNGRYPVHFHGLSYTVEGATLSDASEQFVRNASIWNSQNRCIVLHGTNGVALQNNICYNIVGHAIFLEDGVERRNLIERNLVLKVRNPAKGKQLLTHEGAIFSGGSSGFWITHPDNVLRDNIAADAEGNGIWYAFPERPLGIFKKASIFSPQHTVFGSFARNVAHSNNEFGFQMDWVPTNDAGDVAPDSYRPTANGKDPGNTAFEASLPYTIGELTTYKNHSGALWHREGGGTFDRVVAADNPGRAFAGSANCMIQNSASIGDSLNNATPIAAVKPNEPAVGLASYHSSCDIKRHVFVNLPFAPGKASGAFDTSDYYIRAVDRGLYRNTDLRFINAHTGFRQPPLLAENWTLAGALWDPYGYMGPKGNYWVFDDAFLTDGTVCQNIAPAGQTGKSCKGPYYGLQGFRLDQGNESWGALMPLEVTRDNGTSWTVGDGKTAPKLGNMRHAALVKGGSYTLRFPGSPNPRNLEFTLENMLAADDWALLAVPFDGSVSNPVVYGTSWLNAQDVLNWKDRATSKYVRLMQPAASIEEVRAASGDKYYQDKANNLVYVKLRHDLPLNSTPVPGSDDDLYRPIKVVVAAPN
jgi:hypothetical protein